MSVFLRPEQIEILRGDPAVNDEFAQKVRELDRRLQMNGLRYNQWDTLTDHQQGIFSHGLFLDGECATNVGEYVHGALSTCECPEAEEELHSHSPRLMKSIEQQRRHNAGVHVVPSTNESLDGFVDNLILSMLTESEDS